MMPDAAFRTCGWVITKPESYGIHIRSTWSCSRSATRLAIARWSARSGVCRSFVTSSSIVGSLTRKKFFVDFECM